MILAGQPYKRPRKQAPSISIRILFVSSVKMSSERLENLEDGVTRVLDELKTIIYHQLPELRGGITTDCTDKYFYCI